MGGGKKPPRVTRAELDVVARLAVHVRYVLPDRSLRRPHRLDMDTTNDLFGARAASSSRVRACLAINPVHRSV